MIGWFLFSTNCIFRKVWSVRNVYRCRIWEHTYCQKCRSYEGLVLFRDSLLPRPENGPGTQTGKERILYYLQAHARNDVISPTKLGKPSLEKYSFFGHSLFRVLLHWIYGNNVKGNYNAKFLEAIDFAFKKCYFTFVPKAEQLQAIHAAVTGNDEFRA